MARHLTLGMALAVVSGSSTAHAQPSLPTHFIDQVVLTSLYQPISMAFLPDGRVLITERLTGRIRLMSYSLLASPDPLTVSGVTGSPYDERGLQGIAVDPRWPAFPYVYLCHTSVGNRMTLSRYTGSGDLSDARSLNLTLGSPLVLIDDFADNSSTHNGLALRFGKDGHLLMTTGDDGDLCSAQNPSSLKGALLRLDVSRLPAGAGGPVPRALLIPRDNPFSGPDSNASLVYAYGMRNPWRFHVDPVSGAILLADVGEGDYEELDEVFAGDNLGWPYREGPLVHEWSECDPESGPYAPPILAIDHSQGFSVMTTATVYRPVATGSANWPKQYWGNLFYADFYSGKLRRLVRSGGSWVPAPAVPGQPSADDWAAQIHEPTDFVVGPDGSLYWLQIAAGVLRRIRYTGPAVSVAPEAFTTRALSAAPNPFRGRVELTWRLPLSAPVTIEIFDLAGRRVRRLRDPTGGFEGRLVWDGRTEDGIRVSPGLYLARFQGRQGDPVRLVVLN
jgi:glucose/arabinose dehydrogenase